jgi:hypothetical protein
MTPKVCSESSTLVTLSDLRLGVTTVERSCREVDVGIEAGMLWSFLAETLESWDEGRSKLQRSSGALRSGSSRSAIAWLVSGTLGKEAEISRRPWEFGGQPLRTCCKAAPPTPTMT